MSNHIMPNLPFVADCCGCTACVSACKHDAIDFHSDDEGFLYPHINGNCIGCNLCERVCPILNRDNSVSNCNVEIEPTFYVLHLKDEQMLQKSSSGGAFSAFASSIINRGGIVYGVVYDSNMVVKHVSTSEIKGLEQMRGSKYVQSELLGIYPEIKDILSNGRKVLFTGTPCQVHGLKTFLAREYDNLYTIDVVCHAVPSPMIFKEWVGLIEKRAGKKLEHIYMRDKSKYGWGHKFSFKYVFENGKTLIDPSMIWNWNYIYFSQYINRPSCHKCRYTNFNRPSDITIADFWDDENNRPDLKNPKGKSLCIINTKKGNYLFKLAKSIIEFAPITKKDALQPCLQHPTHMIQNRNEFWDYYKQYGFEKTYKLLFENRYSFRHRAYRYLQRFIEKIEIL